MTRTGEVSITNLVPVPVLEATLVTLPTLVIAPERLALVVTEAALPATSPVRFPVTLPVRFTVKPEDVNDVRPVIVAGNESITDPVLTDATI